MALRSNAIEGGGGEVAPSLFSLYSHTARLFSDQTSGLNDAFSLSDPNTLCYTSP